MSRGEEWLAEGACRSVPPSVMFPDDGRGIVRAKRVCARCTVKAECLAYALNPANHIEGGVWGGQTDTERHGHVYRPPGRPLAPCGSRGSYARGCRCVLCVEASRIYQRDVKRRRVAASEANKHAFPSTIVVARTSTQDAGRATLATPPTLAAQPLTWERQDAE